MSATPSIFHLSSPRWLIKLGVFLLFMPALALFFLPIANIPAAAGYYGCEPADIQYAVMIYYAGFAGFYPLEKRLFRFFAPKPYLLILCAIEIGSCFLCSFTHCLPFLMANRFVQGMCLAGVANLSLSMIFTRFPSGTARAIGFSIFFGALLCIIPVNNVLTADLIDNFDFNFLFQVNGFCFVPGLVILFLLLRNDRFHRRIPLVMVDWQSFILYAGFIGLFCYVLIYGQEHYWLEDAGIRNAAMGSALLLALFLLRQTGLKRPQLSPAAFRYPRLASGALILVVLYICRFGAGLTNTYFSTVLKFDPFHVSYINLVNIAGDLIGIFLAAVMLIRKTSFRLIALAGFTILLFYYAGMPQLLSTQANADQYFLPLLLQGIGVGLLMAPTMYFIVTAVPPQFYDTSTAICALYRCVGFCLSISLINFFELDQKGTHHNAFRDQLSRTNPLLKTNIQRLAGNLARNGMSKRETFPVANRLLAKRIDVQDQLLFTMDYYYGISALLILTLLAIALYPLVKRYFVGWKTKSICTT